MYQSRTQQRKLLSAPVQSPKPNEKALPRDAGKGKVGRLPYPAPYTDEIMRQFRPFSYLKAISRQNT